MKKKTTTKKKVNGRAKGNNTERVVGKEFQAWAAKVFQITGEKPSDWFIRSPNSGAWNRDHARGEDLIVPKWFPWVIEIKNREAWEWHHLLECKETSPPMKWFFDTETKNNGAMTLLVFTKNFQKIWVLARYSSIQDFVSPDEKGLHTLVLWPFQEWTLATLPDFLEALDPVEVMNWMKEREAAK